ncbi:MAG: MarR family winged helix-turn-helix transcriptional regulator [Bellilinea sp.]
MHPPTSPEWDPIRPKIHEHLKKYFDIENSSGLELFVLLQRTAHMSRLLDTQLGDEIEISGPRWRLLLNLLVDEEMGNTTGLTPTAISLTQHVSKNTISVLLRGLETQGLIQRTLDSNDLRTFRIQLTQAGREYLRQNVPHRMENLNQLLSGLDPLEQEQLAKLLTKMQRSLAEKIHSNCKDHESHKAAAEHAPFNEE